MYVLARKKRSARKPLIALALALICGGGAFYAAIPTAEADRSPVPSGQWEEYQRIDPVTHENQSILLGSAWHTERADHWQVAEFGCKALTFRGVDTKGRRYYQDNADIKVGHHEAFIPKQHTGDDNGNDLRPGHTKSYVIAGIDYVTLMDQLRDSDIMLIRFKTPPERPSRENYKIYTKGLYSKLMALCGRAAPSR